MQVHPTFAKQLDKKDKLETGKDLTCRSFISRKPIPKISSHLLFHQIGYP